MTDVTMNALDPAHRPGGSRAPRVRGGDRRGMDSARRRMHRGDAATSSSTTSTSARRAFAITASRSASRRLIATKCSGEKAPEGLRQRLRIEISRTTIIRG